MFEIYASSNKQKACQYNNPIAWQKLCIDSASSSTWVIITAESMP